MYTCVYVYIHMYIYIYVCKWINEQIYIYKYVCIYAYTYVYIHIHIHSLGYSWEYHEDRVCPALFVGIVIGIIYGEIQMGISWRCIWIWLECFNPTLFRLYMIDLGASENGGFNHEQ